MRAYCGRVGGPVEFKVGYQKCPECGAPSHGELDADECGHFTSHGDHGHLCELGIHAGKHDAPQAIKDCLNRAADTSKERPKP
jgi:hypothetical protein